MVFNSLSFALFLTIVFLSYWFIPHKYRWAILLIANIYFYLSFDLKYLIILFANILISYVFGILLNKNKNKLLLFISTVLCLLTLLTCKYLNFSIQVLSDIGIKFNDSTIKLLLPVGISFYTFEIISYLVDVHKGKMEAERNIVYYAIYVSFFPTISSGPIERANFLIPQFKQEKTFDYENGTLGLKLIAWGLFKKIVIADNLAIYVNSIYNNLYSYKGFILALIALFYSIQIYCDFSGYSDMARGVAKLLGIDINENFKTPYLSTSIKEFWSRWHISLTKWLTDYIYIPLGGNRKGLIRKLINILIVFFVSGLWHGANYTFLIWGLIHALLEIIETVFNIKPYTKRNVLKYLRMLIVFVLVTIAWVFFRSNNVNDAVYLLSNMFVGITNIRNYIVTGLYSFDVTPVYLTIQLLIYLVPLIIVDSIKLNNDVTNLVSNKNTITRYALYILLIVSILLLHNVGEVSFIYFKF